MTNIDRIISELQEQRDRVNSAIKILSGGGSSSSPRRGRKPGKLKKGRKFSAAAKKRLSDAAKARWAKAKKEGRTSLKR